MFAPALRASLVLGIVAATAVHSLASLLMPFNPSFVSNNTLLPEKRALLVVAMFAAFGLTAGAAGLLWLMERTRTARGLEWLARVVCPIVLAPVGLALMHRDYGEEIPEALVMAFFIIGFEQLMRVSLAAWAERSTVRLPGESESLLAALRGLVETAVSAFTSRPKLVMGTVVAAFAAQATYMAVFAIWSHLRFTTYGYDLGQYDSIFTNTLHGHWLAIPALGWEDNWSELVNNHADLGVFYMLPFYALHPRSETLLVMQAVVVASAAIPVYLFAKNRLPTG